MSLGGSTDFFKSVGCLKKAVVSVFSATGRAKSKIAGAVQLSGESTGLWWDLKVTPT